MHKGTVTPNGALLRRLRLERGLTQEDLAKRAGYGKKTIQNAEASKPQRANTIDAICGALDVELKSVLLWASPDTAAANRDPSPSNETSLIPEAQEAPPAPTIREDAIERMSIKVWVGQTHGTERVFYSKRQIKEILKSSTIGWTLVAGEGAEGGSSDWEEMGILEHLWKRDGYHKLPLLEVFDDLNVRLKQIFSDMEQRWVQLDFTVVLRDHRTLTDQKELCSGDLPLQLSQLFNGKLRPDGSIDDFASISVAVSGMTSVVRVAADQQGECAPVPPAIRKCLQSFESYIVDRTRLFTGRKYVLSAIDSFLKEEPSGYIIIKGDPGMGKSALLAHLAHGRRYIHHFNIAAESRNKPSEFYRNVCAQIIVRYRLSDSEVTAEAAENPNVLLILLERATKQLEPGENLVIVVDALDEVDWSPDGTENVLNLPTSLPDRVFFIVSTRNRHDDDPRGRLTVAPARVLTIKEDAQWHRDDVTDFIKKWLSDTSIQNWIATNELTPTDFVALLLKKSEANFMYLRHVLPALGKPAGTGSFISADIRASELPHGLKEYYNRHWWQMQSHDPSVFEGVYQPVACIIGAMPQAVSVDFIEAVSGLRNEDIQRALDKWHEFLYPQQSSDGTRVYRLYHGSFREFLQNKIDPGLKRYKQMIAEAAMRRFGIQ